MPLVKIEMLKGKSPEYKKTVFDCVHSGLIQAFGIAATDVFIIMNEPLLGNWGMGGNQKG